MTINWVLVESSRMRYAAGSSMYFAQGIPYGLMNITVPAWLASQGVGAGQIASFLAVIILPWAFKLLSGPLMDRYQFLPMGRRRPWVLGAQPGRAGRPADGSRSPYQCVRGHAGCRRRRHGDRGHTGR